MDSIFKLSGYVKPSGVVDTTKTALGTAAPTGDLPARGSEPSGEQASAKIEAPAGVLLPGRTHNGPERRKRKRASLRLAARIRSADNWNEDFEEVPTTLNASRDGLYFVTTSKHYHVGMPVGIIFPYHSAHDSMAAAEESGEVVRIMAMGGGRTGIGIRLQQQQPSRAQEITRPTSIHRATRGPGMKENREDTRHPFMATATVSDANSGTCLEARCSDLSLGGCYVDTLNPLPRGTAVQLRLAQGARSFETRARVAVCHLGMGMGLAFDRLTPEQTFALVTWLRGDREERSVPASQPTTLRTPDVRHLQLSESAHGLL